MVLHEMLMLLLLLCKGNYVTWDEPMQRAVDSFKFNNPPYSARYVGSMVRNPLATRCSCLGELRIVCMYVWQVSDVHRTLLYGGIYLYPPDKKKVMLRMYVYNSDAGACMYVCMLACRATASCASYTRASPWR